MQGPLDYPITTGEIIKYLSEQVTLEKLMADALMPKSGSRDVAIAEIALAVVRAASVVVQNDIGSTAADLLDYAFQSQNTPVREIV